MEVVKEKVGNPQVESFVLDFEIAAWQACREVFPGLPVKGCVFHWTQSVWKHVQYLGLAPAYRQRSGVHSYIRQLLALPFLPSAQTPQTFEVLEGRAATPQVKKLVKYIRKQWFNHLTFTVPSWGVYGLAIRTNNDVEGTCQ
jgi:hypothetical protein